MSRTSRSAAVAFCVLAWGALLPVHAVVIVSTALGNSSPVSGTRFTGFATGTVCATAAVGNTTGAAANAAAVTGAPAVALGACTNTLSKRTFRGQGFTQLKAPAKTVSVAMGQFFTPPVAAPPRAVTAGAGATFANASSDADWTSTPRALGGTDVDYSVRATVQRNANAQSATASARSVDPIFFIPEEDGTLQLTVSLSDVELSVTDIAAGQIGTAVLEAFGAFGEGDVVGAGTVIEWSTRHAVVNDTFTAAAIPLVDMSWPILADQVYWFTHTLQGAALSPESQFRDFGDAPDTYQTLLASDGPRYQEGDLQRLGVSWDSERDGQPTAPAHGDDLSLLGGFPLPLDDEDGVIFGEDFVGVSLDILRPGFNEYLLRAWWDVNENGIFDHISELFIDELLSLDAGLHTLRFDLGFDPRDFYSRFRLTYDPLDPDVTPFGEFLSTDGISHGEVEDYAPASAPPTLALLLLGAAMLLGRPARPDPAGRGRCQVMLRQS